MTTDPSIYLRTVREYKRVKPTKSSMLIEMMSSSFFEPRFMQLPLKQVEHKYNAWKKTITQ